MISNGVITKILSKHVDVDRCVTIYRCRGKLDGTDHSGTFVGILITLLLIVNSCVVVVFILNCTNTDSVRNLACSINIKRIRFCDHTPEQSDINRVVRINQISRLKLLESC